MRNRGRRVLIWMRSKTGCSWPREYIRKNNKIRKKLQLHTKKLKNKKSKRKKYK